MQTFEKCVNIATGMRSTNSTMLDIKDLTAIEVPCIVILVNNDKLYEFFNSVKDMDIKKLLVSVKYLEALDSMADIQIASADQ